MIEASAHKNAVSGEWDELENAAGGRRASDVVLGIQLTLGGNFSGAANEKAPIGQAGERVNSSRESCGVSAVNGSRVDFGFRENLGRVGSQSVDGIFAQGVGEILLRIEPRYDAKAGSLFEVVELKSA